MLTSRRDKSEKDSRRVNYGLFAAVIWLVALGCFLWGAAMVRFQVFPYQIMHPVVDEIIAFWKGDAADMRSLWKRFLAEVTFDPLAFSVRPSKLPFDIELKPVDITSYTGPEIQYLENARYYSDGSGDDYYLVYGSFAFEDTNWGAILISHDGKVSRSWPIKPSDFDYLGAHVGMALSDNGDLATNTNGVLTSYSWCGDRNWEAHWERQPERHNHDSVLGNDYHHDITYHDGRFYTFLGTEIVAVDEHTGSIVERIHVLDMIRWARKQGLNIFDSRFMDFYNARDLNREKLAKVAPRDPFHFNKVDILSTELAGSFDDFEPGDMLVSMRELNLIFVMRPGTSRIVWHRYGMTTRQHDVTFQRGYISAFDNNPFALEGYSPRIVALDVKDNAISTILDLRQWGAEMPFMGNFEYNDDTQSLLFVDDDNGRAFALTLPDTLNFMFENSVNAQQNLHVRNFTRIARDKVEIWNSMCK